MCVLYRTSLEHSWTTACRSALRYAKKKKVSKKVSIGKWALLSVEKDLIYRKKSPTKIGVPEVCTVYWKGGARVKRDLVQREKRPTISAKETYLADLSFATLRTNPARARRRYKSMGTLRSCMRVHFRSLLLHNRPLITEEVEIWGHAALLYVCVI